MKYSFVTIVFDAEFYLITLQARSMQKYLPAAMVDEIFVIVNGGSKTLLRKLERTRRLYGALADKVRFVDGGELDKSPSPEGWVSQQVLKLLIATMVKSERYVVLDTKTHLIDYLTEDFLASPDGRARTTSYGYLTHNLRPRLERALNYLGLEPSHYVGAFPTSVPPIVIYTQMARDLIDFVANRAGQTFSKAFVAQGLTEFFLYFGWVIKCDGSMDLKYENHERISPVIWEHQVSLAEIRNEVARGTGQSPFLSVHRRSFSKMRVDGIKYLSHLWHENNLFNSQREAEAFIRRYRRGNFLPFVRETIKRRVKKLKLRLNVRR